MSLKARLSQLQRQVGGTATTATTPSAESILRSRLAQLRPERVQAQATPTPGTSAMSVEELEAIRLADFQMYYSGPLRHVQNNPDSGAGN